MINESSAAARQQPEAIRFNRPFSTGSELAYIVEAIRNGHISGDGAFTRRCQGYLEELFGCAKALLTTSCTDALELAALLLDLGAGDEVIVPSFTFVSTVNCFVLRGAVPRFIDIRPDTLNLDATRLKELIGPKTKAILPVHYAGVGCEMDEINRIAEAHGLAVIEDNAHGFFGKFRGRMLGTFGDFATLSFHETKNITCGEGGALLINAPRYVERAEILREKGTNRSRFFRGQVDKYTWVDVGSSFLPSDILAAYLWSQLENSREIQSARKAIWTRYNEGLQEWAAAENVMLPAVPEHCEQPYHMFYLLLPSERDRDALIAFLKEKHIHAVFHYLPLHLSDMGKRFGPSSCEVTESVSKRLVRLPFYNTLAASDQSRVIDSVRQYRSHAK